MFYLPPPPYLPSICAGRSLPSCMHQHISITHRSCLFSSLVSRTGTSFAPFITPIRASHSRLQPLAFPLRSSTQPDPIFFSCPISSSSPPYRAIEIVPSPLFFHLPVSCAVPPKLCPPFFRRSTFKLLLGQPPPPPPTPTHSSPASSLSLPASAQPVSLSVR